MSQGPEYGDASACLKITYPGDPARPAERLFKMRAPTAGQIVAEIPNSGPAASPEKAVVGSTRSGATSFGDTDRDFSHAGRIALVGSASCQLLTRTGRLITVVIT